jgi:Transposase C of IS166 homeodomain
MNSAPEPLPNDAAALHALLAQACAERDAERAQRVRLAAERDQLAGQNDRLRHLIRQLQRLQFGRRSERLDPDHHTPLYRQSQILARQGIAIGRSVLALGEAPLRLTPTAQA